MKALVLSVIGTAALVAFVAPREDEPVAKKGKAVHLDQNMQLAAATKPQGFGGEMVLDREDDGHFYATANVDGSDYRMLVDTGASVVALTGEDARNMGLNWDPNALAPVARGASGPVMGVNVTIPEMAVGDFEAKNVPALIIPEGLGVSLLGQSFLRQVPKVDIADNTLTLSS